MKRPFVGSRIIQLDSVDSTNNFAAKQLSEGELTDGTVIMASFQSSGKGQRGSNWQSLVGLNLLCSIVLLPKSLKAEQQFYLSKVISIAIAEVLHEIGVQKTSIKWPNDILADKSKIAGILIENSIRQDKLESSIIGIGLNVNQKNFSDLNASSVLLETGRYHPVQELATQLFKRIDTCYGFLLEQQFELINQRYNALLFGQEKRHSYQIGGEKRSCIIDRVGVSGELFLECENEILGPFGVRDIELLRD